MTKPTFYEWLRDNLTKENDFGKFALCAYTDPSFPRGEIDYYNMQGYVWSDMKFSIKLMSDPKEVFNRIFIAYAIEWNDNYEAPLLAHENKAGDKIY